LEKLREICDSVSVEGDSVTDNQLEIVCNLGKDNEFFYVCYFNIWDGMYEDKNGWLLRPDGKPSTLKDRCNKILTEMFGIEYEWSGRPMKIGNSDWCRHAKRAVAKSWFTTRLVTRNKGVQK